MHLGTCAAPGLPKLLWASVGACFQHPLAPVCPRWPCQVRDLAGGSFMLQIFGFQRPFVCLRWPHGWNCARDSRACQAALQKIFFDVDNFWNDYFCSSFFVFSTMTPQIMADGLFRPFSQFSSVRHLHPIFSAICGTVQPFFLRMALSWVLVMIFI